MLYIALDFSKTKINSNIKFELIIDRGSGTHCTTEQFKDFLEIYKDNFHKNIRYFALDWFSNKHSESKNSQKLDHEVEKCEGHHSIHAV